MRTVLYYEYARNKKSFLQNLCTWMILFFMVFLVSVILERYVPGLNEKYLKLPDMVQELLGIGNWNRHIYVNIWYLFGLIMSIYIVYAVMSGLVNSVVQEDRLETIVYLKNMSVGRGTILFGKYLFWVGYAGMLLLLLFLENVVFLAILKSTLLISIFASYYGVLLLACLIYLALALFLSSYARHEANCNGTITNILLFTVILSRVGAFVQFVADLMVMRGQEGEIIVKLESVAHKIDILRGLCPAMWCWSGVEVTNTFYTGGVVAAAVMVVGAFWIYVSKGKSVY